MPLSRRSVLAATALPAVAFVMGTPAMAHANGGKTYYVAADGDDGSPGTFPVAPWRSVNRVNAALADGTITRGDSVLFRRGQRFYGQFGHIPQLKGAGRLTLGAYGEGERPRITGYKVLNNEAAWVRAGRNLWRIDLGEADTHTGNTATNDANVAFIQVNGEFQGAKQPSVDALAGDWQFHCDLENKTLTVYSADTPAARGDVRCAVDGCLIQTVSDMTIEGLELVGTGGDGIQVLNASGVRILDNRIRDIGGSYLLGSRTQNTRYGNGVSMWINAKDVVVSGNTISDVYDAAVAMKGDHTLPNDAGGPARTGFADVHVSDNRISKCSQSFEIDARGVSWDSEAGLRRCSFANNACSDAGMGWGYIARPDKAEGGVHIVSYAEEPRMDLAITGNKFIRASNAYMYRLAAENTGLIIDKNTIRLAPGQTIQYQRPERIEDYETWTRATGFDRMSTFVIK